MTPVIEYLGLVARLPTTHRSIAVSVAVRVLVVGATLACASGAQGRGDGRCGAALDVDLDLLQGGITAVPRSHVSVSRTADMLLVHVLEGEVLFSRHETAEYPVVVTAGNARLRDIHAVVCVKVHKGRTDVSVFEGVAELSEVMAEGARQGLGGITLRAGDQVKLRRVGEGVEFRLVGGAGADAAHCAGSTRHLWKLAEGPH